MHEISWLVARRAEALHRDASEDNVLPTPGLPEGQMGNASATDVATDSDIGIEAQGQLPRAVPSFDFGAQGAVASFMGQLPKSELPRFKFVTQGAAASIASQLAKPMLPRFEFAAQGPAAAIASQLAKPALRRFQFAGQGAVASLMGQLPRPVLPRFDLAAQGTAASIASQLARPVLPRFDLAGQGAVASLMGQLPKFGLPRFEFISQAAASIASQLPRPVLPTFEFLSSTDDLDVAFGAPPVHRVDPTTNRLLPGWLQDEESLRAAFRFLLATSGGCMFLGLFLVALVDPAVKDALEVLAAEAGIAALLAALYALANSKPR